MIPKKIFYVWGVNEPKRKDVLACMQSWRQNCPDYEIVEINEDSKEYFDFRKELQSNRWFRTVYEKKMWAYVADYIRIKVLYENGGIYLDTDVFVVKTFGRFLDDSAFVGMQDNAVDGKRDKVEPAILGAQKHNNLLKCILDVYEEDIWRIPIYTMPDLFDFALKKLYSVQKFKGRNEQDVIEYSDIKVYPERFFIPFRFGEKFSPECVGPETYTIHWWGASWVKPEMLSFLENKHKSSEIAKSRGYYRRIFLFSFIPLLKIYIDGNKLKIARFTVLTVSSGKDQDNSGYCPSLEVKLLKRIPLFKVMKKERGNKRKYYFLGLPLLKIA